MAVSTQATTIRTLSLSAVAVGASVAIPLLVHVLPAGSVVGAALLPIFWAPLLAVMVYGPVPAAAAAVLAPLLNHLLTGMPPEFIVGSLTAELAIFVAVLIFASKLGRLRRAPWVAPVAYLVARVAVGAVTVALGRSSGGWSALFGSLPGAWPGLLALFVVALAASLALRRRGRG